MPAYEDAQYNDTFDDIFSSGEDSGDELDISTFTAETAGRELGIQPVQRYDLAKLKLWEVMYTCGQQEIPLRCARRRQTGASLRRPQVEDEGCNRRQE